MSELQVDGLVFDQAYQMLAELGVTPGHPIDGVILGLNDMPIDLTFGVHDEPPTITSVQRLPRNDADMVARVRRFQLVDGCVDAYLGVSDTPVDVRSDAADKMAAASSEINMRRVVPTEAARQLLTLVDDLEVFEPYAE